jgi:DNA-binding protein H-NS
MKRYNEILTQIEDLKRQAEEVRRAELKAVIAEIKDKMDQHGITLADLKPLFGGRGRSGGKARSAVKPKYRNSATGETWTGRGRAPRWLAQAEAAGRSRDSFLIKG